MVVAPLSLVLLGFLFLNNKEVNTLSILILYITAFSIIYILVFYKFSMNQYERQLFTVPLSRSLNKLR